LDADSILYAIWIAVFGFSYLVFLILVVAVTIRGTGELKRLFRELANPAPGPSSDNHEE
jgi:hypothetical protein